MRSILFLIMTFVFMIGFTSCSKAKAGDSEPGKQETSPEIKTSASQEEDMDNLEKKKYVPGQILVKFKPEVDPEDIPKIIREEYKCEIIDRIKGIDVYQIKIPAGKRVPAMVELLNKDQRIKYAEPNTIYRLQK